MKIFPPLVIAITPAASAFAPAHIISSPSTLLRADVKLDMATTTRRDALSEIVSAFAIAATATAVVQPAMAASTVIAAPSSAIPADNEIVKEQRTVVNKLDVNNAAVADYMQFPGMYPTIGGKIANGGPYTSVKDVYKLKGLSREEIKKIKGYEGELVATPATGLDTLRGRDPYRRSFNK